MAFVSALPTPRFSNLPPSTPYINPPSPLRLRLPSRTVRSAPVSCSSQSRRPTAEFERLFSNLNRVTLKREPGSVTSAVFLVAGMSFSALIRFFAVGAGILAIPAVTLEAGFLGSAITCIFCWMYMVVTGLLIAEVNVNTMCELGSGGVSLVSMAKRTLGNIGVQVAW